MEAQNSASGTPTPEALLGMLGKLKRTLTQNLSEQKRTTDDQGYIAAANIRSSVTDDVPNLLRPSPGLEYLSEGKLALPTDEVVDRSPTAAALKLESSAPPMDLDRPQGSLAQPIDLSQRSSMPSYLDADGTLSLTELAQSPKASTTSNADRDSSTASAMESKVVNVSAAASDVESAPKLGADSAEAESAEAESAAEATSTAKAEPAVAAESALETGPAVDTAELMDRPAAFEKPVQHGTDDDVAGSVKPLLDPIQDQAQDASVLASDRSAMPSDRAEDGQDEMQVLRGDVSGGKQVVGGDRQLLGGGGYDTEESQKEAREEMMPSTEEGLDSAMQELAQEVSQLQPNGQVAASEGPMRQGSYLHRHTSSIILKMSQDAAIPPLPAVANLGPSSRSQPTPTTVTPGTAAKPGEARKTIKSMAASLFRAFDEGKLRERGPPLVQQQDATESPPAEQPLTAAIRTYKSSPKRREAAPATRQQSVSPARTISYSVQKASLRRSLSPNIGRQASPLRQPQWDSSKPARTSPQHAQRATAALTQAIAPVMPLDPQPSPHRAPHAVQGLEHSRLEQAQHAQHAAVGTSQPLASSAGLAGSVRGVHQVGISSQPVGLSQTPEPQAFDSSAALSSVVGGRAVTASTAPGSSSAMPSSATPTNAHRKLGASSTPSPPRFRRLPSTNLVDRPAWASITTSRAAPPSKPGGSSPLRRSTGSTTIAAAPQGAGPPPQTTTIAAAPKIADSPEYVTDSSAMASDKALSFALRPTAVSVGAEHSQASSDSRADYLTDTHAHAHAQALQRLQQAVEDYHSSSPHVLVPAAVELAAALRRAAKGPAPARPSLEALQLAGLKLKHEVGEGNSQSVPSTPWPEWVRGAWGSPQTQVRGAWGSPQTQVRGAQESAPAVDPKEQGPVEVNHNADKEAPQRAQRNPKGSNPTPFLNGWSPVKRPESMAGRRRSALVSRALAEAEAAAAKSPAAQARPHNPPRAARAGAAKPRASATPPRGSAKPSTVLATPPRSSATPPKATAKPSRVSATPPGSAATPPRATQQAGPSPQPGRKAVQHKLRKSLSQASGLVKVPAPGDSQAVASRRRTGQPNSASQHALKGHSVPVVVEGSQPVQKAKPPPARAASKQRENALQAFGLDASAQQTNVAQMDRDRECSALMRVCEDSDQPAEAQHSDRARHAAAMHSNSNAEPQQPAHAQHAEAASAALHSSSNAEPQQSAHAEHAAAVPPGLHSNLNTQSHAVVTPVHTVTSVAALRQSFELMSPPAVASVESVKARNRLPLRKVSSKAHVHEGDGSPQQAVLLWQKSLRGADAEHGIEPDQATHQGREAQSKPAGGATTDASPLYHTMSALVAQRLPARPVADQSPALEAAGATGPAPEAVADHGPTSGASADQCPAPGAVYASSPASPGLELGQMGSTRLTEAVLAAAYDVRSSAEKLPVSHRLPVSRSVFDSDEGSLVSSDDQGDTNPAGSSPQDGSVQPLAEEATLALLPDRGMSPVSESAEEHAPSVSGRVSQSDSAGQHRMPAQHAQRISHSNQVNRDEIYPWSSLGWAFSPSWIRVICHLCPSPTPHFATPLPPHTLQTSLGMHAADTRTYTFDQVLASNCSQQDVAEQASGVVEAVLQGRNSVVLAMGQPGKLLGDDPNDPEADSTSPGVSTMLVEALFSEMQQQRLPAQVHSVYVTAFQIVNESIQDLLQTQQPDAGAKPRHLKGSSSISRHDVFVDKQKRTWVSNLAAVKISSSADFQQMLELVSSGLSHTSQGSSTRVITLLVTADIPTASIPSSAKQGTPAMAASQSQSPSVRPGDSCPTPTTRVCSKLSFVEVGSSTVPVQASPVRTVSTGQTVFQQLTPQLGRGNSGVSVASSWGRRSTSEDRPWGSPSGAGGARGSVAGGRTVKPQDTTMRSVSEVVWAAAHGKGMPVPHRACKLTRYLQDTLCPSGRAVAVVCINPCAKLQTSSIPALTAAERMMPL